MKKRAQYANVEASKDVPHNDRVLLEVMITLLLKNLYSKHLSTKPVLLAQQNPCYSDLLKLLKVFVI